MSKLKMNYTLATTQLTTDEYSVQVKITPINKTEVEIQFGHFNPASQIASAADLRELASIFVEAAELLEGPPQTTETAEKPSEEPGERVSVMLEGVVPHILLQGVFSKLTSEQANALQQLFCHLNTKLPKGQYIYTAR